MPIFHVPYQKHVIFPISKFEIKKMTEWRYSMCLLRNMSFFHFLSSKEKKWPNGDIPCAWSETCHFSNFQVRNKKNDRMAIFHVPSQKHVIFPLFKFEIKILAKCRCFMCLVRNMSFFQLWSLKFKFDWFVLSIETI